jgi:hypothetical protein
MPAKRPAKVAPKPEPQRDWKLRGRLVPVTAGLPPDVVVALDAAATRMRLSRTKLMEIWLAERLEREGYLKPTIT